MINPTQWYTLTELVKEADAGSVPFKAKSSWISLIQSGQLKAIKKGTEDRFTYVIQGSDIIECLNAIKVSGDQA